MTSAIVVAATYDMAGEICAGVESTNTSTHAFEPGTAKRVKVKQDAPNKPVRVLP